MVAHEVRAHLTDDRRSVRIYGSQVVVGRLYGSVRTLRVRAAQLCRHGAESEWHSGAGAGKIPSASGGRGQRPEMRLLDYSAEAMPPNSPCPN